MIIVETIILYMLINAFFFFSFCLWQLLSIEKIQKNGWNMEFDMDHWDDVFKICIPIRGQADLIESICVTHALLNTKNDKDGELIVRFFGRYHLYKF